MKKVLILAVLAAFFGAFPAQAATVTSKKDAVSVKTAEAKKTNKVISKKTTKTVVTKSPAFSAEAASQSTSATTGTKPPEGYMEALKKAEDDYYAAVRAAKGNKAKLKAASDAYDADLAEAMELLD